MIERVGVARATRIGIAALTAPVDARERLGPLATQARVVAAVVVVVARVQIGTHAHPTRKAVGRGGAGTSLDARTVHEIEAALASTTDGVTAGSFAVLQPGQWVVRIAVVGRAVAIGVSHGLTSVERLARRL